MEKISFMCEPKLLWAETVDLRGAAGTSEFALHFLFE